MGDIPLFFFISSSDFFLGMRMSEMNAQTSSWLFEFLETGFSSVLTKVTDNFSLLCQTTSSVRK